MRKLSLPLYTSAFVISLVIFLSGIFVGRLIDTSALEDLSTEVSDVSQRVISLQLLLLMEGNSSSFCPVYSSELDAIDEEVERMGYKLSYLEEQKEVVDEELKKQYFVLQAESYLLSKKVKEVCGDDTVLLIHFYSNKDCQDCRQQGSEILKSRDNLEGKVSMKLYSFDGDLGSPIAEALKNNYGVATYPTIVINEAKYAGYTDSETLSQIILNETTSS